MTFRGPFDPKFSSVAGTPAEVHMQSVLGIWKKFIQQGVVGLTHGIEQNTFHYKIQGVNYL